MINFLAAGFLSAFAVRILLSAFSVGESRFALALIVPIIEETAKTGLAIIFSAGIFYTHIVFGGLELVMDSLNRRGIWPGITALAVHSVLGFMTQWVYFRSSSMLVAVVTAVVIHSAWNFTVVTILGPRQKNRR